MCPCFGYDRQKLLHFKKVFTLTHVSAKRKALVYSSALFHAVVSRHPKMLDGQDRTLKPNPNLVKNGNMQNVNTNVPIA